MTARRLAVAAACALLLAVAPGAAAAAGPRLTEYRAEGIARTAAGVPAVITANPGAEWSCVYAADSAFWSCQLSAAVDGQALAVVKLYDPQERVWSVTIPRRKAPTARYDAKQATAVAARDPRAAAWIARYRDAGLKVTSSATLSLGTWAVKWWSGGTQIAEVGVNDLFGGVTYVRTGPQVAWSMARGGQGFGRLFNEPWAIGTLLVAFVLLMLDWRRLRSLRTLDVLMIASLAVSLWCFNRGLVFWAVPLQYPPLAYLLVRMLMIGLGRAPRPAFATRLPLWALIALIVVLAGGRVAFNAYSSNVVDVGLAGVVGAERILDGRSPYGTFPVRTATPCGTRYADGSYAGYIQADGRCEVAIERGDTYGPVMYLAYVPGTAALGWSGRWDDLPAAHFTSGLFDLLTAVGLGVLGLRLGGRRLAAALAVFWLALPWSAYTFMSDSNDAVVAALLAWSAALLTRPIGRGALLMAAALAKFSPLLLIPLWLRLDRAPPAVPGEWAYGLPAAPRSRRRRLWEAVRPGPGSARTALGMVVVVAAAAALLLALGGRDALQVFWERTFGWQLDRPSPFSLWDWGEYPGFPDLAVVQKVLKASLVLGALGLLLLPRHVDHGRALAFAAALLLGFQIVLTHWMYLYLPWALVLVGAVLLAPLPARPRSPRRRPSADEALPQRVRPVTARV